MYAISTEETDFGIPNFNVTKPFESVMIPLFSILETYDLLILSICAISFCVLGLLPSKPNLSSIINIKRTLKVENTGTVYAGGGSYYESDYLRSKSAEYIPVPVANGYGEVTLTSNPVRSTNLTLNSAECDCIYTVMSDYIVSQRVQPDGNYFSVSNSAKYINAVKGITAVKFGGKEYTVNRTEITDSEIQIYVDQPIEDNNNLENILYIER